MGMGNPHPHAPWGLNSYARCQNTDLYVPRQSPIGGNRVAEVVRGILGEEVHYYMVHIAYYTELILQICDYAQKQRIWRKNCKYAFDENFHCHFCSRRKAAKFCHPALDDWMLFLDHLASREAKKQKKVILKILLENLNPPSPPLEPTVGGNQFWF